MNIAAWPSETQRFDRIKSNDGISYRFSDNRKRLARAREEGVGGDQLGAPPPPQIENSRKGISVETLRGNVRILCLDLEWKANIV